LGIVSAVIVAPQQSEPACSKSRQTYPISGKRDAPLEDVEDYRAFEAAHSPRAAGLLHRGNPYYKHAVNQPFRSGRSRFFGYIEAQVLHAVIRHYKPARLIEIGGGVPSYCTSQAISMNRRDTGLIGRPAQLPVSSPIRST